MALRIGASPAVESGWAPLLRPTFQKIPIRGGSQATVVIRPGVLHAKVVEFQGEKARLQAKAESINVLLISSAKAGRESGPRIDHRRR